MKFTGVMIGTEDSEVLGGFYAKVLGPPGFREGPWYGWLAPAQFMIGTHSEVSGRSSTPQRVMLSFEVDDVRGEFDRIKALGADVVAEPYQPDGGDGAWLATFADPDGNYFQLASPWTQA